MNQTKRQQGDVHSRAEADDVALTPHQDARIDDDQSSPASPRCYEADPRHPERVRSVSGQAEPDLTAAAIHGALRAFVLDPHYPCVGARSAMNHASYRLGVYDALGSAQATDGLARDLALFAASPDARDTPFATFIAVFEGTGPTDPAEFEALLWRQLQRLHDADDTEWAPDVASDPEDPHFSYSFAGTPFFVVGLHPGSERLSRRFPWPALVFNPHAQFERLRAEGKYERMQAVIRNKDLALQGDINPVLRDHGTESEARQYSGREPEPDWVPPFEPRAGTCPFHGDRLDNADNTDPESQ